MPISADSLRSDEHAASASSSCDSTLRTVTRSLGLALDESPMPISIFKAKYGKLLDRAHIAVQRISRGKEIYFLLTEEQFAVLAAKSSRATTLADTLADIPVPSMPLSLDELHSPAPRHDQFSLAKLPS